MYLWNYCSILRRRFTFNLRGPKIQILLSNLRKLFDNFVKHLAPRRTDLIGEMASLCFPTFNEMLVKT